MYKLMLNQIRESSASVRELSKTRFFHNESPKFGCLSFDLFWTVFKLGVRHLPFQSLSQTQRNEAAKK